MGSPSKRLPGWETGMPELALTLNTFPLYATISVTNPA
jgi:hypothetical protein